MLRKGTRLATVHTPMRRSSSSTGSFVSRGPAEVHALLSPDQLRVVALGGGTGLPIVLEGLRHALFNYRFDGGDEVSGHSLGNLILTALSRLEQDFAKAIEQGSQILGVRGRVFPSTTEDVRLRAELADGSWVEGESRISSVPRTTIRRVSLEPEQPAPFSPALDAALQADLVVLGPGSLYTSVIPVLLVRELAEAIRRSGARVVLVMNLTTEPGETDGYTAADHLLAIRRHAPDVPIHDVLLNTTPIPDDLVQAYSGSRATLVAPDIELLRALGHRPVTRDLLGAGPKIRHDARKLSTALVQLARRVRTRGGGLRSLTPREAAAFTPPRMRSSGEPVSPRASDQRGHRR